MEMTRRAFIVMSAGTAAAVCTGCTAGIATVPPSGAGGPVDIGTKDDYPRDGVYDNFTRYRFFVMRRDGQIHALSAICPHRRCSVLVDPGNGFVCPCHGATFDKDGRVTHGPATKDLHRLQVTEATNGHLFVHQ